MPSASELLSLSDRPKPDKLIGNKSRFEIPITPKPESELEKRAKKLQALIAAVQYKDIQERIDDHFPKDNTSGKACERKIVACLRQIGILPVIELAPPSLDKPDGCSKVDIILMLPSGRVLAAQSFSAPSHYNETGAKGLRKKSSPTISHGIKKLQRRGVQLGMRGEEKWYSQEVLGDFPMPIGVAAVDENLVLDSNNPATVAREFLHNLSVGMAPDIRRRLVESGKESYSPLHDHELRQCQQELSVLAQRVEPLKLA